MTKTKKLEATIKHEATINDVQKKLKQVQQEQSRLCMQEIDRVITPILNKYNCQLDISIILRQGQVIPQLGVIPKNI